jgi:hypothetical protein
VFDSLQFLQAKEPTMTDKASDEPQTSVLVEGDNEEELDDNDYTPHFIRTMLDNDQLLPRDFLHIFERFEYSHLGRAKTTVEFILVNEATKLTLNLQHLDRVETTILVNQQRPAVESLFRKTHEGAAMRNVEAGINSVAILNAAKYFADPAFKASADKAFEVAGYAPNALEGEAYLRALPSLAVIHRQKAANRKALFSILKELESRYASRHCEKSMVVGKPPAKPSKSEDG